eukprot:358543-Chlamydomonas_euryale.AAC.2
MAASWTRTGRIFWSLSRCSSRSKSSTDHGSLRAAAWWRCLSRSKNNTGRRSLHPGCRKTCGWQDALAPRAVASHLLCGRRA